MIDFDQYTEYKTESGIYPVALDQHALDSLLTLTTLADGYAHVATLGRAVKLDAVELDTLKANAPYHADVIANEITSSNPATIVGALIAVRSRLEWHVGLDCVAADAARTVGVYFNPVDANLYRCIQAHKAQPDWRPDLPGLGALWIRFYEPETGPQPWVQPTGAHDAYNIGDRVLFNGKVYESLINANVWSPAAYPSGWKLIA